jgi:adenylate kinase
MIYKILLIGPQGSGKGTQAEILSKRFGIPAFAMGQLLRDEVASGTDIGLHVNEILESGNLVSDQIASEVLQARLRRPDAAGGYILDGYPRNMKQYATFTFDHPTHVVVIDVPQNESLTRLSGRLTCDRCGKVYAASNGSTANDPCICGGLLKQRSDDTPEAIGRRLDIYDHDTTPMLSRFEERGILRRVDGVGTMEEVQERILKAVAI